MFNMLYNLLAKITPSQIDVIASPNSKMPAPCLSAEKRGFLRCCEGYDERGK